MGHECSDPCHDENGRERKRTPSIVPSSSFPNSPSGLEGFSANPQNSHHYYRQPQPLSAVSGVSTSAFSDAPVRGWRRRWGRTEPGGTRLRFNCGVCMHALRPTGHMGSGRRVSCDGWSTKTEDPTRGADAGETPPPIAAPTCPDDADQGG